LLLCYITDRKQLGDSESEQRERLFECIAAVADAGIHYIQLREKDLSPRALLELAQAAVKTLSGRRRPNTRLLINSRIDVAMAAGADGVHLPSGAGELPASEVRALWMKVRGTAPVIGVSCHTRAEVEYAEAHGADFCLFGPVFEKNGLRNPAGTARLRESCLRTTSASSRMPILALGGVTLENAPACIEAGAAGVAGIRLFQGDSTRVRATVDALRCLHTTATPSSRHPYQT
jgi:thiamine-phosphate pyrophosphorylase